MYDTCMKQQLVKNRYASSKKAGCGIRGSSRGRIGGEIYYNLKNRNATFKNYCTVELLKSETKIHKLLPEIEGLLSRYPDSLKPKLTKISGQ